MDCQFKETEAEGELFCVVCQTTMRSKYPPCKTHRTCSKSNPSEPSKPTLWQQVKAGLWGDVTESVLSSVGLTKDRWQEIIGGKCACGERQEWLNKVGQALTNQQPANLQ
jgi:hypothetical protein